MVPEGVGVAFEALWRCHVWSSSEGRISEAGHFGLHAAAKSERSSSVRRKRYEREKLVASRAKKPVKATAARSYRSYIVVGPRS